MPFDALCACNDGYVRVFVSHLPNLRFTHFLSGLDDDASECNFEGGSRASISGYTEWLTDTRPIVTAGWDWHLDLTSGTPIYVREGLPRTNLMLVDGTTNHDLGDTQTGLMLSELIDQSEWQANVSKHIATRYA
jgi:hypothetical protein